MRVLSIVCLLLLSTLAQAQNDAMELARADIRSARMSMIALAMELNSDQQNVFWPIYNEYAKEQDELMAHRMDRLANFAENYSLLDDKAARALAEESFATERARIERRERYFSKFAEAIGPVLAARFIQVDWQISTLLDFELLEATPLIVPPQEVEVTDN